MSGAEGSRTPDLRIANATLSQLSYRPMVRTTTVDDSTFAQIPILKHSKAAFAACPAKPEALASAAILAI